MKNSDILKKNMESETNIFTKKLRNVPHSQFLRPQIFGTMIELYPNWFCEQLLDFRCKRIYFSYISGNLFYNEF